MYNFIRHLKFNFKESIKIPPKFFFRKIFYKKKLTFTFLKPTQPLPHPNNLFESHSSKTYTQILTSRTSRFEIENAKHVVILKNKLHKPQIPTRRNTLHRSNFRELSIYVNSFRVHNVSITDTPHHIEALNRISNCQYRNDGKFP